MLCAWTRYECIDDHNSSGAWGISSSRAFHRHCNTVAGMGARKLLIVHGLLITIGIGFRGQSRRELDDPMDPVVDGLHLSNHICYCIASLKHSKIAETTVIDSRLSVCSRIYITVSIVAGTGVSPVLSGSL